MTFVPTAIAFTERTRADGPSLDYQEDLAYTLTNPGEGGRTQNRMVAVTAIAPTLQASLGHHGRRSPRGDGCDALIPAVAPTLGVNDSYYRGDPLLPDTLPSVTSHYGKGTDSDATDPMVVTAVGFDRYNHRTTGAISDTLPAEQRSNSMPTALVPIGTRGEPDGPANALNARNNRYDGESQSYVVAETLRSHPRPGSSSTGALAFSENQRAEVLESPLVRSMANGGGKPGQGYPAVRSGLAVRRLLPIEAERLMSWPDDWTRWTDDGKEIPDTHRYRLVGNGVVANVAAWIARRLVAVHADSATQLER